MSQGKRLVELVLEAGFLDMERVLQAQKLAAETGLRLAAVFVRYRFVSPDRLARFLSSSLKVDVLDLDPVNVSPLVAKLIPEEACRKLRVLPLGIVKRKDGELLNVAMIDPTDDPAVRQIEMRLARKVRPLLVDDGPLERAIERTFGSGFDDTPTLIGKSMSDEQRREAEAAIRGAPASPAAPAARPADPGPRMLQTTAPAFEDHVLDLRSVVDEQPYAELEPGPARAGKRVCFVSTDQVLTMIVESGLRHLVGSLDSADDLDAAFGLAHKGQVDAVVLCEPPADEATRSLVAQLSSMATARVVVVSTLRSWREAARSEGARHAVVDPPENLLQLPDAILAAIEA